jgi:hypothetical protein
MTSLDTIVYHVGENTEAYPPVVTIPDMDDVYAQIVAANNGKYPYIYMLPIYNGHLSDWATEKAWILSNFQDIPIMLDVFSSSGGDEAFQLSTEQIQEIITGGVEVKYIRIFEVIGWYGYKEITFPEAYVIGLLTFCKNNGIKVFWSEWSDWYVKQNITMIRALLDGFEDIVTFGFGTNSDVEPEDGYKWLKGLGLTDHWGASIQAWYWDTRHNPSWSGYDYPPGVQSALNMPVAWMITHAQECKSLGGQLIQFEPYWYFFGYSDGKARSSLKTLHDYLNSSVAQMDTNLIILQTLMGEWAFGPAKDEIQWLEGRAETGWDIQPSAFDFMKMPKKCAVSCFNVGTSNPSGRLWLKVDIVAVEVLVKVLGSTLEKAALSREAMRVEVERILQMYSVIARPWCSNPVHRRRIPGLKDVVIIQEPSQTEDANLSRFTIQVKCKVFPRNTWVSWS